MSLYDSKVWISALDETIDTLPFLYQLEGTTILVTGSTGLICSSVIDLLIRWNHTHSEKIEIVAAGRSREKTEKRFSPYTEEPWFTFVPFDATAARFDAEVSCDYIIHGASNASPRMISREPVETMISNFLGLRNLMEYAREHASKRVLFISSSEIYGKHLDNRPYNETEYGYIDILNPRNSYSVGKRAAETLCASYASEYGVDSVIVRPGHIYGPTASESDNRVSSAWAFDAAHGKNIVMKSDGAQIRSYCYCLDCASAILTVLHKGTSLCAYNISNPNSIISIRQMAEILSEETGVKLIIECPTEQERKSYNPMPNSSLDGSALLSLGWQGLFDASRGFKHTVQIMKCL